MSTSIAVFAAVFGGAAAAFVPRVADRLAVPSGTPSKSACSACARPFPGWVRAGAPCPCTHLSWHTMLAAALAAGLLGAVLDASPALPLLLVAVVLAALLAEIDMRCLRLPDRLVGALAFVLLMASAAERTGQAAEWASAGRASLAADWASVWASVAHVGFAAEWASVAHVGLVAEWASVGRAGLAAAIVGLGHLVLAILPGGGLGLGDVKLAAVLAFALGLIGWPAVLLGVLVPYLINGPIAVYLLLSRRATRRTPLPFGPALLAGALIAFAATSAA